MGPGGGTAVTYLLTVAASLYLVFYPIIFVGSPSHEFDSPLQLISRFVRGVGSFLPDAFDLWVGRYVRAPEHLVFGLTAVALFTWLSAIRGRIGNQMLSIWKLSLAGELKRGYIDTSWEYKIRTNRVVRFFYRKTMLNYVIPPLATFVGVYITIALFSQLTFNFADASGVYCHKRPDHELVSLKVGEEPKLVWFDISSLCMGTGVKVDEALSYEIFVDQLTSWKDGSLKVQHLGNCCFRGERPINANEICLCRTFSQNSEATDVKGYNARRSNWVFMSSFLDPSDRPPVKLLTRSLVKS